MGKGFIATKAKAVLKTHLLVQKPCRSSEKRDRERKTDWDTGYRCTPKKKRLSVMGFRGEEDSNLASFGRRSYL